MSSLAKKYSTKNYMYDCVMVGFVCADVIYWHSRRNGKYICKTKRLSSKDHAN